MSVFSYLERISAVPRVAQRPKLGGGRRRRLGSWSLAAPFGGPGCRRAGPSAPDSTFSAFPIASPAVVSSSGNRTVRRRGSVKVPPRTTSTGLLHEVLDPVSNALALLRPCVCPTVSPSTVSHFATRFRQYIATKRPIIAEVGCDARQFAFVQRSVLTPLVATVVYGRELSPWIEKNLSERRS